MSSSVVAEDEPFSSPSFSSYLENKLAEIAEKVAAEASPQNAADGDEAYDDDDDDFEFSLQLPEESAWDSSDGRIFPVFNRDLLSDDGGGESRVAVPLSVLLRKEKSLHRDDDKDYSCSSSSEADELETIPSGTYCVWRPNKCKKSPSAGSASSRWAALRDLMKRSNSEGMKDKLVFLTPKKNKKNKSKEEDGKVKEINTSKKGSSPSSSSSSAHEDFYVRNRAVKEGDRKKSYLPYRKELVGFFFNGN